MANKQSKRARREAALKAKQRKQRMTWGGMTAAIVLGIGLFVFLGGSSANEAAAVAPDFELEDADGGTVKLSDFRGQPVAVTFMHTW